MSQKKVEQYKKEKANREQIMKQQKRKAALERGVAALVIVAIVGWLGFSVYGRVQKGQDAQTTETVMDASAIDGYLNGLKPSEAE